MFTMLMYINTINHSIPGRWLDLLDVIFEIALNTKLDNWGAVNII